MKIATFNINNVNRRLPNLLEWLKSAKPDIVCLQELKCTDAQFPVDAIGQAGYHAVWRGQRTWNGVAILSRGSAPVLTRTSLPGDPKDEQARYIEAAVDGILISCLYLPNGNPQPGPKFNYKLAWFKRLAAHARKLLREDVPVVLAGDYNVAPTAIDIYRRRHGMTTHLCNQKAGRHMRALSSRVGPTPSVSCMAKNVSTRSGITSEIGGSGTPDSASSHLLLSPLLASRLRGAGVDRSVRDKPGASDHAPAWLVLDAPQRSASRPRKRSSTRS